MKKIKGKQENLKMKFKLFGAIGMAVIIAVIGIGYGVKAYQSSSEQAPKIVNESGGIINYNEAEEANALDYEMALDDEIIMGAMSDPLHQGALSCYNDLCTYIVQQNFIDASTTIVSIVSPFIAPTSSLGGGVVVKTVTGKGWTGATSTVDLARLYITTAATTSFTVLCGAATQPNASPAIHLIGSGTVATSSGGIIENNVTTAMGAGITGSTTAKIVLTPDMPYFNCVVTPSVAGAITQTTNELDGKIIVRFNRMRF